MPPSTRPALAQRCWYPRLDVQLRPSPVTTLGVVLSRYAHQFQNLAKIEQSQTWIFVSVFKRNHWGIGLNKLVRIMDGDTLEMHLFCRPAFARILLVRKDFWEG